MSAGLALAVAAYDLPFQRPFVTASGIHERRRGWLVRLTDARDPALLGFGEAAPLPGHGGEDPTKVLPALTRLARCLAEGVTSVGAETPAVAAVRGAPPAFELPRDAAALALLDAQLRTVAPDAPCARAAVTTALADAAARRDGVPLARWLRAEAAADLAVNATIGALPAEEAVARAQSFLAQGFRTLKLKLGDGPGDGVRATRVRAAVGREVRLRGDANGAWEEAEAGAILRAIGDLDLEYVEQPVPAAELEAMRRLRAASPVPIAADEALLPPRGPGPEAVLAAGAADVWVIKPALCGGPIASLALAAQAEAAGVAVVLTTALDGAIGRAMAAHVASALPGRPHADGLATGGMLAEDVAEGLPVLEGRVRVFDDADPAPGLGVAPVDAQWRWADLR
jgi:o-succinylbenzoate synthase